MAYVKILYQDSPSTATPINAHNLNHMDDQIALNDQRLSDLEGAHVSSFNGRTGAITPAKGDYNIGQIAPLAGATVGQVPVVVNVGTEEDPELEFQMGAGGGGGHVIQNSTGTDLSQEPTMQFVDAHLTDDSVNGRTVVENVKSVASADYSSETEDGMYLIPDGEGAVIEPASDDKVEVTADGVKTYGQLLNELYALIDSNSFTLASQIELIVGSYKGIFNVQNISSNEYTFVNIGDRTTKVRTTSMILSNTSSIYDVYEGSNDPLTNTIPSNGTKITLYYGNKKATVDLQTTANRCWMSDGKTVESEINGEIIDLGQYLNTAAFINDHPDLFKAVRMGSMIVMNICGVAAKADGSGQTMLTLPANFFSGYASGTVFTDASSSPILMAGVYTNGSNLACHVPSGVALKKLWGQIVLRAGSYFD